jgi:hypothetical protein
MQVEDFRGDRIDDVFFIHAPLGAVVAIRTSLMWLYEKVFFCKKIQQKTTQQVKAT